MKPACRCHNSLSSPWALLLSRRCPAASASCMTACFPTATVVTAYRWRHGACFPNDACLTGASRGCQRRQTESVQHARHCSLSALMHPPARRQCATRSAVVQSFAQPRQMEPPMRVWSFGTTCKQTCGAIFKLERRCCCAFCFTLSLLASQPVSVSTRARASAAM